MPSTPSGHSMDMDTDILEALVNAISKDNGECLRDLNATLNGRQMVLKLKTLLFTRGLTDPVLATQPLML